MVFLLGLSMTLYNAVEVVLGFIWTCLLLMAPHGTQFGLRVGSFQSSYEPPQDMSGRNLGNRFEGKFLNIAVNRIHGAPPPSKVRLLWDVALDLKKRGYDDISVTVDGDVVDVRQGKDLARSFCVNASRVDLNRLIVYHMIRHDILILRAPPRDH